VTSAKIASYELSFVTLRLSAYPQFSGARCEATAVSILSRASCTAKTSIQTDRVSIRIASHPDLCYVQRAVGHRLSGNSTFFSKLPRIC